ncbi:MAG TPA: hypothetical protein VF208_07930 [Candidatus Binatia bacterium]
MENRSLHLAAALLFGLLAAGCATTTPIVSEWRNPAYDSASFPRIMFGALGGDAATRRNFEDEFITQLRAVGAHGVASYRHIAEVGAADESTIKDAARQAGANALIIAKLVGVEERTQYSGPYFPYSWFGIYGSHGGVSMSGPGGAPIASRYLEYTTETALLDVAKNELVWTATTMARETAGSESAVKSTVQAVVKALVEKNLLGPPQ